MICLFLFGFLQSDWKEEILSNERLRRFTSLDSKGAQTNVIFDYDLISDGLVRRNEVDEANEWIALAPNLHLWGAHPEYLKSTEDFFREALANLGWKIPVQTSRQNILEALELAQRDPEHTLRTGADLLRHIEDAVLHTRADLLKLLDIPILRSLKAQLESYDIVEPYRSQISHDEFRFDAFVLLPLRTYLEKPEDLTRALKSFRASMPTYPLRWFFEMREEFSLSIRLSILSLLTHNHQTESLLLQAVALEDGLEEAWEYARLLSDLYEGERAYWIDNTHLRRVDAKMRIDFPSGIRFLDNRQKWEVNISLKANVFGPSLHFQSQNKRDLEVWLPYFQLYHFYGAFIVAARLKSELNVDPDLIPTIAESLGLSYKLKTMGWNSSQLQKMRRFYFQGATDALLLSSF